MGPDRSDVELTGLGELLSRLAPTTNWIAPLKSLQVTFGSAVKLKVSEPLPELVTWQVRGGDLDALLLHGETCITELIKAKFILMIFMKFVRDDSRCKLKKYSKWESRKTCWTVVDWTCPRESFVKEGLD
jgi:hypothetical protein